jgi:hypothetical protein
MSVCRAWAQSLFSHFVLKIKFPNLVLYSAVHVRTRSLMPGVFDLLRLHPFGITLGGGEGQPITKCNEGWPHPQKPIQNTNGKLAKPFLLRSTCLASVAYRSPRRQRRSRYPICQGQHCKNNDVNNAKPPLTPLRPNNFYVNTFTHAYIDTYLKHLFQRTVQRITT